MKFTVILLILIIFAALYLYYSHKPLTQKPSTPEKVSVTINQTKGQKMTIKSSAFADHTAIPEVYTCDGKSINPPLTFGNVPSNAKSLVMIMDDPDVPKKLLPSGIFDHWIVYNISPNVQEIAENSVPAGVSQGLNGSGQEKYTGPCPPDRQHRYFFKLYALDTTLKFQNPASVTKQMVIDAMQGHIIEQAEMVGLYNRPQNK